MNSCKLVCFLLLQAVTVHALRLFSPNAFGFSGQEQLLPVSRCTALQSIKPNRGGYIEAEGSGSPCRIKVIGVGGGGGNAVNRMMESTTGVLGVEMWAVNTDAQALSRNLATNKLNIGSRTSRY